jgi:excisionase family DNA binding protein
MKSLISVRQFSEVTGIGYKRSRQLVSSGTIPSKQVGCRRLISTRWLDRWLEEGSAGAPEDVSEVQPQHPSTPERVAGAK